MGESYLKIGKAFGWTVVYLGVVLFYTFLDVTVWRNVFPETAGWLNTITTIICVCGFIELLRKKGYRVNMLANITPTGLLLAVGCSVLFYLLLDNFLDPIFESLFPVSEQNYQETIQSLRAAPVTSLLQVCIIAPVIEEIFMRGFVLGGLKKTYGGAAALLVSSALFALLHFNMVQTFSAFICAIFLGSLYLYKESILCCIIAHCGYNLISYVTMICPYIEK